MAAAAGTTHFSGKGTNHTPQNSSTAYGWDRGFIAVDKYTYETGDRAKPGAATAA